MLSLDLFATQYERELHEGAVDNLEARRIDDLNMRMLELLDRAKEPAYKKNPEALAGLKRQFQKIKAERDSYFKINPATGMNADQTLGTVKGALDEGSMKDMLWDLSDRMDRDQFIDYTTSELGQDADEMAQFWDNIHGPLDEGGIPGNVPTEKIPGKEDLLKGRGRSYYEDQKKNSEPVDEYISMGSDKNYTEAEPYKNYRIYVRRKPFGTTGMYTAHTEIDRKEFMGKGPSQEEAVQAIRDRIDFVLNAQRKVTGSSTIDFNVKFATDLLADPRQTFYAKLENINGEPKLVIASADVASDPELLAAGDFKRSTLRNQPDESGRATPLPGIPLTAKSLRSGDWIANGRYTIGKETSDRDGNRVFDLTYHSTAHTKSDKLRLNQPAFTLGTAREVDEHGGGIGPRQHWQSMMPEGQPQELVNRYLAIDAENDVDAIRAAIQAISKDPALGANSKSRLLGQIGMIIKRHRLPIGRSYYTFMQQYMEAVELDRNRVAGYPRDPATVKHRLDTAKAILGDPRSDADSRREAAAIVAKSDKPGVNETVENVRAGMAKIYHRLAPKIERHRDSFLAGQLYDELENYAELHGAEGEFKRMMNGARNRAHMEYDTNPGGFQNWFWFLPFEDNDVAEGSKPGEYYVHTVYFKDGTKKRIRVTSDEFDVADYYTKRGQAVDHVDYDFQIHSDMTEAEKEPTTRQELLNRVDKIQRMMSQERNPANLQILRKELETIKQRYQHLREDNDSEAVERAILNRIMVAHTDLLMKFGPDKVMQAAEEVAYNVGDVDEIGTSDVSAYVQQVKQILGATP